jgi:hypothetical protein
MEKAESGGASYYSSRGGRCRALSFAVNSRQGTILYYICIDPYPIPRKLIHALLKQMFKSISCHRNPLTLRIPPTKRHFVHLIFVLAQLASHTLENSRTF